MIDFLKQINITLDKIGVIILLTIALKLINYFIA